MPDQHGFDHLQQRGTLTLRCIWCPYTAPASASERVRARHARAHRKDVEASREASKREVTTAQTAIVV